MNDRSPGLHLVATMARVEPPPRRQATQAGHATGAVVRASGWVSVARGVVGLLVPRAFARLAGTRPDATRTRLLFGVREVVIGAGLLASSSPNGWLRARLVGDAVDVMLHTREVLDPAVRSRRTVAALALVIAAFATDAWLVRND